MDVEKFAKSRDIGKLLYTCVFMVYALQSSPRHTPVMGPFENNKPNNTCIHYATLELDSMGLGIILDLCWYNQYKDCG